MNPRLNSIRQQLAGTVRGGDMHPDHQNPASGTWTEAANRTVHGRWVLVILVSLAAVLAGCGSSSGGAVTAPIVAPARTYSLAGFELCRACSGRPENTALVHDSAALRQAAHRVQEMLRAARGRGSDHCPQRRQPRPVRRQRHADDGKITQPVVFPAPGRYRIVVSAFLPESSPQSQNNFQLFTTVHVRGSYRPQPIPPFNPTQLVDGYRFQIQGHPRLKAIQANFLTLNVLDLHGRKATFTTGVVRSRTRSSFTRARLTTSTHTSAAQARSTAPPRSAPAKSPAAPTRPAG